MRVGAYTRAGMASPMAMAGASIHPVDCAAKASALSAALPASVPVIAGWQ
jgi:hypothetical protein